MGLASLWKRRFPTSILWIWILASAAPTLAQEPTRATPKEFDANTDPRGYFFQRVKSVADSGSLFDSKVTAELLALKLDVTEKEMVAQPPACEEIWKDKSELIRTGVLAGDPWFKVLPNGAGHISFPQAFINPPGQSGDAGIQYIIQRTVRCTDRFRLQDHTEAHFTFGGLPSFACITGRDILDQLPGSRFQMATDGVSFYFYQGKRDDDSSTTVAFLFRMGAGCALSATIEQNQETGLRYLRANSTRRICEIRTDQEFCSHHPPFDWGDGGTFDEMALYADKICGTTDAIAKADKTPGVLPLPLPSYKIGADPCHRHDS